MENADRDPAPDPAPVWTLVPGPGRKIVPGRSLPVTGVTGLTVYLIEEAGPLLSEYLRNWYVAVH